MHNTWDPSLETKAQRVLELGAQALIDDAADIQGAFSVVSRRSRSLGCIVWAEWRLQICREAFIADERREARSVAPGEEPVH